MHAGTQRRSRTEAGTRRGRPPSGRPIRGRRADGGRSSVQSRSDRGTLASPAGAPAQSSPAAATHPQRRSAPTTRVPSRASPCPRVSSEAHASVHPVTGRRDSRRDRRRPRRSTTHDARPAYKNHGHRARLERSVVCRIERAVHRKRGYQPSLVTMVVPIDPITRRPREPVRGWPHPPRDDHGGGRPGRPRRERPPLPPRARARTRGIYAATERASDLQASDTPSRCVYPSAITRDLRLGACRDAPGYRAPSAMLDRLGPRFGALRQVRQSRAAVRPRPLHPRSSRSPASDEDDRRGEPGDREADAHPERPLRAGGERGWERLTGGDEVVSGLVRPTRRRRRRSRRRSAGWC